MKAIILAGGRGKRLKPITDYVPKPLIPINNMPIIEWQIRYLKKFGIRDFIICTGYKTEQIENYLDARGNLDVRIRFSKEKKPLGTGGAIRQASSLLKNEKTFLVINGDVITNIDVSRLKSKPNTLAAINLKTKFGIIETNQDRVVRFIEKPQIAHLWMNAGIYHLSRSIIRDLPIKGDIEKTTFSQYAKKTKLNVVKFKSSFWFSIDSHKDIEECSQEIKLKKFVK